MFLRIFLTLVVVVVVVLGIGIGAGIGFVSASMQKSIENDLVVITDIADELISDSINLLKADANRIAAEVANTPASVDWAILENNQRIFSDRFNSLTILSHDGAGASVGDYPTSSDLIDSVYMQDAFAGQSVMSTTRNEQDGTLTIHVCVPIDDSRVLSATVPGLYFDGMLSKFTVWKTGHVFVLDEEGTMVADTHTNWVQERYNLIELAKTDERWAGAAGIMEDMVAGESGVEEFDFDDREHKISGRKHMMAYKPITGSMLGWSLGVVAPLSESPAQDAILGIAIVGIICLVLSLLFGYLASKSIEKPYIEAKENREMAEQANGAKSAFLATVSHEMRTPLNAVIGLSELTLATEELTEPVESNLVKIYHSGATLLGIINDILDLSKVEAGKLDLIPVDYDIPSLINDTVVLNSVRIGSKPIKFNLRIDANMPSRLRGDDLRVKQIFNNLLSNAFKYTKEGEVDWEVKCERDGETVWLTSCISDTGIGITEEDLEKLFSEYGQVDKKSNRKIEGTGLGLSLTKKMVELMGGAITVESEYGKGSAFTIRIKQEYVNDVPIGADVAMKLMSAQYIDDKRDRSARLVRANIPYGRVLVVDDVATNLDVARGLMKPYNMQVDCVSSGKEAIKLLEKGEPRYDAVFMDHMMPEMDGIEATRIIREGIGTDYAQNVPIIALTANAIVGNEEMFLGKGFQAFIAKPIDIIRLDGIINQYVRDKEQEKTLLMEKAGDSGKSGEVAADAEASEPQGAAGSLAGSFVDGVDLKKGLERFGCDEASYLEVIRSFVKNTPPLLGRMQSVSEANLPEFTVTVHGVKGSCYAICANAVGKMAEALEQAGREGDFHFVERQVAPFAEEAEKLVDNLAEMSRRIGTAAGKPVMKEPDMGLLAGLGNACRQYSMDRIDEILFELEENEYGDGADLLSWIREKIALAEYAEVSEKIDHWIASRRSQA
ncbi:MAG: response regulator [Clostridiales Family XIII bacterium]|nr:response regulator [Clostridiales Family XIII bacterium]